MCIRDSIEAFREQGDLSLKDKTKIADSYRMIHDTKNAEIWYRQIVNEEVEPMYLLHYAQILQSNKKNQLAAEYYEKYSNAEDGESGWGEVSKLLSQNLASNQVFNHTGIKLSNEQNLNSQGLDYSPMYFAVSYTHLTLPTKA